MFLSSPEHEELYVFIFFNFSFREGFARLISTQWNADFNTDFNPVRCRLREEKINIKHEHNSTPLVTAGREKMGGIAWAVPGSIGSLFLSQVLIISYLALPDEAAELDAFQTTFPAELFLQKQLFLQNFKEQSRIHAGKSHTNLIRKEQNVWQRKDHRDHLDPEESGFSQGQKYSYQNSSDHKLLSPILLLPGLTIPDGLNYPFHW